ncbi:MAG: glutamyl-tRNA reductase [Proteobacteria bacterium]|nr:glutamyl-tRNA reductase [Pseudomonadota bacterium]
MSLAVIGLNHKSANIDVRERLSVPADDFAAAVDFMCVEEIKSCVVFSTCNRTEFYLSFNKDIESPKQRFCEYFKIEASEINQHLYIKQNLDCINHLFEVSSGLDSMVLGETQILGQVKTAYEISKQNHKLNNDLDRLFQSAFRVTKSVRSDTDIGKNPVSIANSAVKLSKQILGDLAQQNVLMIGAGSTAELLLRYLSKHVYCKLSVCNRSLGNAQQLAKQFNADSFDLSELVHKIADYDLIFTATASQTPIIDSPMIKQALKQRKHKPMVIIDLAIPRDVDISVKKFDDVFYYEVDDLQKVVSKNLEGRKQSSIVAKQIIKVESEAFEFWLKGQQHTQLIHNFQKETDKIRKQSLDKALKQLKGGADAQEVLIYLANSLTKKLNHAPVKAIRNAIQSGDVNKINNIKQLLNLKMDPKEPQ